MVDGLVLPAGWRPVLPWTLPEEARSARHLLANRVLPLQVALDLCADSLPDEVRALLESGVSALSRDVLLVDLALGRTRPAQEVLAGSLFNSEELGDALVHASDSLAEVIPLVPVSFGHARRSGRLLAVFSCPSPVLAQAYSSPEPSRPFAIPPLGLELTALAACVSASSGHLAVSSAGAIAVFLRVSA